MPTGSYQERRNIHQSLRLDDLVNENAGLIIKLQLADTEIGNLKLEVERLEDGQLTLKMKLEESDNEIGRLNMKLKHQVNDLALITSHPIPKVE